jgi:hypothetical protein
MLENILLLPPPQKKRGKINGRNVKKKPQEKNEKIKE